MSRKKKARSAGNTDVIVIRERSTSDQLGRDLKKQKKRKGLKSGSRHSQEAKQEDILGRKVKDPRIGSKKKIPLIVEAPQKLSKQQKRENAEKELDMLENDAQLNVLLDRLDNGDTLGEGLQKYVDEKLDRIEQLMKQLGLFEEDSSEQVNDESQSQKKGKVSSNDSEDDLLSRFENLDVDNLEK
ncbi:Der GTPase-activating protein YihI [Vibrio sp.]|uniref:Der GTPase-activating protein YihI n=1 Tax=Vibrio viridaestus TaxID=2487322 RepID=A0A3N9TCA8_9VIBR|nr:Der GTPase-activating protein YihI [Vibrio viridaestus]MDC0611201.1 Der GTPase-activating protein YihI [Vibrio sp.]RQW61464.1 GTPase-activating protein [Vibrio viridaestus]